MKFDWRRLSAAQLNGIGAALGVALVQALLGLMLGSGVGLAAAGGAVCASLPDVPNAPRRVWRRVLPAVLLSTLVTLAVGLLRGSPLLMALLIAAIGFVTLMAMAWGPRAGPLSFSGILALVFAMAWDAFDTPQLTFEHSAWVLLGGLLYALWARAVAELLRRRYRELALAAAMRACVARLRSRAVRIAGELPAGEDSMRVSIRDDVQLAEALQGARDQVFAARSSAHSRRQVDMVLGLIELRDLLLASRLDTKLLGDDAAGMQWRRALADSLLHMAQALSALAAAVAEAAVPPEFLAVDWRRELAARIAALPARSDDPRQHLLSALQGRVGHMLDDVAAMCARFAGADREASLTPAQLQQFVSPEGWPLAALKSHWSLQSGVMRHALRGMLALTVAYLLGLALPWAAHPHWLVLSVAVVLRGNLEQTLSRRNERIIGTVIGCLLVLALAHAHSSALLTLVFICSVGVAHAYVNVRYRVAATAATLMALLQPLLLNASHGPAVGERLADTVLGALLAWAFCFVLPSWERRSLQRLTRQLCNALARHAAKVLQWAPTPEQQLAQRLSRQQAYTALAVLAGASQRTRVEPAHVRVPEQHTEALLTHGYRLMALLGAVQQLINRRAQRLDGAEAALALQAARASCVAILREAGQALDTAQASPSGAPVLDLEAQAEVDDWPEHRDDISLTPWLQRRLRLCEREARWLQSAELALMAELRR